MKWNNSLFKNIFTKQNIRSFIHYTIVYKQEWFKKINLCWTFVDFVCGFTFIRSDDPITFDKLWRKSCDDRILDRNYEFMIMTLINFLTQTLLTVSRIASTGTNGYKENMLAKRI